MKNKIAPSVMCCDFCSLKEQIEIFNKTADLLHMDVMDGRFVPNIALGTDIVRQIRKISAIPLDLHFMVEEPEKVLGMFEIAQGDYVSVHAESTKHLQRVLQMVKERGAKALVALNPATPIVFVEDVLDDADGVLIMGVNPGFAGQKLVPHTFEKIRKLRELLDGNGKSETEIEVDGNVSFANAVKMSAAGANIFVGGTSSVFNGDMAENVKRLREIVNTAKNNIFS